MDKDKWITDKAKEEAGRFPPWRCNYCAQWIQANKDHLLSCPVRAFERVR